MLGFGRFHPAVIFSYYILVLIFSMISLNPAVLFLSAAGAFFFFWTIYGWRETLSEFLFFAMLFVLVALANPIFVHNGETILFFMNDNAITLEAAVFGGASSLMIAGVVVWCRAYGSILTTDKFLYLFGRLIPRMALLMAMTFRFIPLFRQQIDRIGRAQKSMGIYATDAIPDRIRGGVRIFDSLISWSMENAIDTADSMKARGYGLKGRTTFSLFKFRREDRTVLLVMIGLAAGIFICFALGAFRFYYYPVTSPLSTEPAAVAGYILVAVFMFLPGGIEIKEKIKWHYLTSKI